MSTEDFKVVAEPRELVGKGASRRLRRLNDKVPGIVYGDEKAPVNISMVHKDLVKHLEHEAFYSHIISLEVGGKSEDVILKDLQRHPAKDLIMHADFLRVSKTKKIHMNVPLHFINEDICVGVKTSGGSISHTMTQLEISCLAKDLPEFLEVDLAETDIGQVLHISDVKLPEGVESVALSHGDDHNLPVVSVHKIKGIVEDDEAGEEGDSGATEETSED